MPIYEFECHECGNIEEFICSSMSRAKMVGYMKCTKCAGVCNRVMSTGHFFVKGYNAINGYASIPTYDEVIDANGYAKKKWGK